MGINTTKFRSPETNKRYTSQLFWDIQRDLALENRLIEPMYSLHDDVDNLINFRKEYLKDMDPTGYTTSFRLLENYEHWKLLMRTAWFKEAKKLWDEELNAKQEAEAMNVLNAIMKGGDDVKVSEQISAAKTILGKTEKNAKKNNPVQSKRGRPTNEEVQGELKKQAELTSEEQEDWNRIRSIK